MTELGPAQRRASVLFSDWLVRGILFVAVLLPALNLLVPVDHPLHVSNYTLTLLGKYLALAILALSIDLLWGYCGILSLGHGAFSH